jgi:hypothetical protein
MGVSFFGTTSWESAMGARPPAGGVPIPPGRNASLYSFVGSPSQDAAHDVAVDSTGIYVAGVLLGLFVDGSEVFGIGDVDSSSVPGDAFMNVSGTSGTNTVNALTLDRRL